MRRSHFNRALGQLTFRVSKTSWRAVALRRLYHFVDDLLTILVLLAEPEPLSVGFVVERRHVDVSLVPVVYDLRSLGFLFDHLVAQNRQQIDSFLTRLHHALVCNVYSVDEALGHVGALLGIFDLQIHKG